MSSSGDLYLTSLRHSYDRAPYARKLLVEQGIVTAHFGLTDDEVAHLTKMPTQLQLLGAEYAVKDFQQVTVALQGTPLRLPFGVEQRETEEEGIYTLVHLACDGYFRLAGTWLAVMEWISANTTILNSTPTLRFEIPLAEAGVAQHLAKVFGHIPSKIRITGLRVPRFVRSVWRNTQLLLKVIRRKLEFSLPVPKQPGELRIVILVSAVGHHFDLLRPLLARVKSGEYSGIQIVILAYHLHGYVNVDKEWYQQYCASYGVVGYWLHQHFYSGSFQSHQDFYQALKCYFPAYSFLEQIDPLQVTENEYATMRNALTFIDPQVVLHMGVHEPSRILADVARGLGIKSVNLQYGLNLDQAYLSYNACFDVRACINQAAADLWAKRADGSRYHAIVGFIKHDAMVHKPVDRDAFLLHWELPTDQPVVFFPSSPVMSAAYLKVFRQFAVATLAEVCQARQWTLLIKKHPLESDSDVAEQLANKPFHWRVLPHTDASLAECIYVSDVVVNGISSSVLDAIYYQKPVVNLLMPELADGGFDILNADAAIPVVYDATDLSEWIAQHMHKFDERLVEQFLYRNDSRAYDRVIELCRYLAFKSPAQFAFPFVANTVGPLNFRQAVSAARAGRE